MNVKAIFLHLIYYDYFVVLSFSILIAVLYETKNEMYDMTNFKILAELLCVNSLPTILYADFSDNGRFYNPPAKHIELAFMINGGFDELMIGDKKVSLHAGEISLHNVHFGNFSPVIEGSESWCIFLEADDLPLPKEWVSKPFFNKIKVGNPQKLILAFKTLAEKCRLPGLRHPGYLTGAKAYDPNDKSHTTLSRKLHIKAALLEVLAVITQNVDFEDLQKDPNSLPIIDLAMEYIAINFSNPDLNLTMMAEYVGLSDDYFGQLFKKHISVSPIQYLRTVRIEQAKVLLTYTNLPIKAIAKKIGYYDPLYFSRIFKSATGCSPRSWK